MLKKSTGVIFLLLIALTLFLTTISAGCQMSKVTYEERMTKILEDGGKKLKKTSERKTKEQIDILKEIKKKVKAVSAPDDFFSGHSDLVEFLDLFVTMKEKQLKSSEEQTKKKKGDKSQIQPQPEIFETYQAAMAALSRASSELPFLEYEMRKTFKDVLATGAPTMQPPGIESIENLPVPPSK